VTGNIDLRFEKVLGALHGSALLRFEAWEWGTGARYQVARIQTLPILHRASRILHPYLNKAVEPTPGIRTPHRHSVTSLPRHFYDGVRWIPADLFEQTPTNLDNTKSNKMK
jgi:hypothetical protein